MVSREQKRGSLQEKFQLLRSVTNSHAENETSIIMDASKYIQKLKQKVERFNEDTTAEQSSSEPTDPTTPMVTVETLEKGFMINVFSGKNQPGMLVSVLEAFEDIGLNVLEARVSLACMPWESRNHHEGPDRKFRDWEEKFGKGLGIGVVELTGETALDLKLLAKQRKYIQQVGNKIRIVALSTIGASSRGLFNFPPNVRPVPPEIHIQGVDILSFETRMQDGDSNALDRFKLFKTQDGDSITNPRFLYR